MHLLYTYLEVIITRAMITLFTGFLFTVSAVESSAGHYADALGGSGMEKTIATVEASKENEDTSLECSLTTDDSESRTMEVPAEPLTHTATYGNPGTDVQRNGSSVNSAIAAVRETTAVETGNSSAADGSYVSLSANNGSASTDGHNQSTAASDTDSSSVNTVAGASDGNTGSSSVYTTDGNKTTAVSETDNSSVNTTNSSKTTAVSEVDNSSASTVANAADSNEAAATGGTDDNKTSHHTHTTSVYADDDTTLVRVEYLDDNGKIVEYSEVTNYDKDTNSYTETVYMYDWDEEKEYVTRTNTYVDGELVSSENP